MDRREFLTKSGAAAGLGLAGATGLDTVVKAGGGEHTRLSDLPDLEWDMPTSWPAALDTIYGGAVVFAEEVGRLTGGKFVITPAPSGELVPGTEVLQNVESGAYPIGHTASYYYIGLAPWTAFGTAVPFGLNARQQNAWLYEGGGLEMLQGLYADNFGVIQFPAGNTGCQMGGWFKEPLTDVSSLEGLNMRIPGLGGEVMARLGVNVQLLPGAEIFQALQTGAIDAAEWVGPYDDFNLGFPEIAKNYYYPGWWEAGPSLEVQVNKGEYDGLPEHYQNAIQAAAFKANVIMLARYDKLNHEYLTQIEDAGVTVSEYPADILEAARTEADALMTETAEADADFKTVYDSFAAFREASNRWFGYAERSIINLGGS